MKCYFLSNTIKKKAAHCAMRILLSAAAVFYIVLPGGTAVYASSVSQASNLDFSNIFWDDGDLETDGYHWDMDAKTLTLKNIEISGKVILPDDTVTIRTEGTCSINTLEVASPMHDTHLTFDGAGELTVQNHINISGSDGLALTVAAGARVVASGGISIGASGGVSSTVSVNGTLTAVGAGGWAVYAGKVVVGNGGVLNVSGEDGVIVKGMSTGGKKDFTGVFTVVDGGCFNANCGKVNVMVSNEADDFSEADTTGADQAFNIPANYSLPEDCKVERKKGEVNLVRISTGSVYTGALSLHKIHSWPDTWNKTDTVRHWKECTYEGCGKTKDSYVHRFNSAGNCACGAALSVDLDSAAVVYTGQEQKPGVTVKVNGETLDTSKYSVVYRNNINAGEASVTVKGNGEPVFEQTKKFSIARATPTITWGSAAQSVVYSGKQAVITPPTVTPAGGAGFNGKINYSYAVSGQAAYTPGLPTNAGTYTVKAAIQEQGNYNAAESGGTLTLTVEKADYPPNMPSDTMKVARECEMVSNVRLPKGWQWKESDKNTALEINVPATVTAVYVGADKDNYKNVTTNVAITREERSSSSGSGTGSPKPEEDGQGAGGEGTPDTSGGKPVYTFEKYGVTGGKAVQKQPKEHYIHDYDVTVVKEASCTEAGEKKYVCPCGESYTESIPAYGHSYRVEITKEPTISEKGEITYTCSRCQDTYSEPVDWFWAQLVRIRRPWMPWWILAAGILAATTGIVWFFVVKRKEKDQS